VVVGGDGGATNVNSLGAKAVPPAVDTEIRTVPAGCDPVVALIAVGPVTVNDVAAVVPNLTDEVPVRLVPVMVTDVPPSVLPLSGVKATIVGTASGVTPFDRVEAGPVPTALWALTVNVYVVPSVSPTTVHARPPPDHVQVFAPGELVTV
jgi:hypothetical protein